MVPSNFHTLPIIPLPIPLSHPLRYSILKSPRPKVTKAKILSLCQHIFSIIITFVKLLYFTAISIFVRNNKYRPGKSPHTCPSNAVCPLKNFGDLKLNILVQLKEILENIING